jgi:hypothetical protein
MAFHGNAANANVTTDVSQGNYGGSNAIPIITVDSDKRISAINTASLTINASINANASVGDAGTYGFLMQASGNTSYEPGQTLAGSNLRYADSTGRVSSNVTPTGTWRLMGYDSGAPRTNSGSGSGTGSGNGNISGNVEGNAALSGGNVEGNVSGALQGGEVEGNTSLSSGNIQGNQNVNVSGNISVSAHTHDVNSFFFSGGNSPSHRSPNMVAKSATAGGNFSGSGSVSLDNMGVGGNVTTAGLNVAGNVAVTTDNLSVAGNVATDNLNVGGNAAVNVSTNVSVNTTVAYPTTLWLRSA